MEKYAIIAGSHQPAYLNKVLEHVVFRQSFGIKMSENLLRSGRLTMDSRRLSG